jgi:hypothetical protein
MDREASSWALAHVQEAINEICSEYVRPSVLFKARVSKLPDGRWCAFMRDVFITDRGISATEFNTVGNTPDEAMRNFDRAWVGKK